MTEQQAEYSGWPRPLLRPADDGRRSADRVGVDSRSLSVDGRRVLPVSGELHYWRVPRADWAERLGILRASGVTAVASYVPWIVHEPEQGHFDFTDGRDVAAFVREVVAADLDFVLRIGPWCHGELRNGGFPDWLSGTTATPRTDDPVYLDLVVAWFDAMAAEVAPFCAPGGRVIAVQVENELYDQPAHLRTLRTLAQDRGIDAPIWTATAWGGAQLPPGELLPVFSGYSDGFWVDSAAPWDSTFREHFVFGTVWDDPGVGADQHAGSRPQDLLAELDPAFPPVTCELGGGMATAYHRRPRPGAADIAAIANVKLGNGSAWQGFYMYGGGTNPASPEGLQESQATGYPNDMPVFDYDFHAPLDATGASTPTLDLLREHNAFASAFGERLGEMASSAPADEPRDADDLDTLRWRLRSDGASGFVFVNSHRPVEPMRPSPRSTFVLTLADRQVRFPDRPIVLPPGVIGRWPVGLRIGAVRLEWATASAVTVVQDDVPLLVLREHPGVPPLASWTIDGEAVPLPRRLPTGTVVRVADTVDVLLLADEECRRLWAMGDDLLLATTPLWRSGTQLRTRSVERPHVMGWSADDRRFIDLRASASAEGRRAAISAEPLTAPGVPPLRYGGSPGRAAAPSRAAFDGHAGVWRLDVPPSADADPGRRRALRIRWSGDVAQLRVDGEPVADRFWDGSDWRLSLDPEWVGPITLHIAPLLPGMPIHLEPSAQAALDGAGLLCGVHDIELEESVLWTLDARPRLGAASTMAASMDGARA